MHAPRPLTIVCQHLSMRGNKTSKQNLKKNAVLAFSAFLKRKESFFLIVSLFFFLHIYIHQHVIGNLLGSSVPREKFWYLATSAMLAWRVWGVQYCLCVWSSSSCVSNSMLLLAVASLGFGCDCLAARVARWASCLRSALSFCD